MTANAARARYGSLGEFVYSSSVPEVGPDCADDIDGSEAPTQRMAKPTNNIVHDMSDPRREGAILTSCRLPFDPCESNT